jgi:hypothetical protein
MKSNDLTNLREFLKQNKNYTQCEVCEGKGYATFEVSLCDECKNDTRCESCIFYPEKTKKKMVKIDNCPYCSGTGYRTWIDELRRPYPKDAGEWTNRSM